MPDLPEPTPPPSATAGPVPVQRDLGSEPAGLTPEQAELARAHGISLTYVDWRLNEVAAPAATVLALLAALGVAAQTPAAAESSLADLRSRQRHALPPCVVTVQGVEHTVTLTDGEARERVAWVETEDGRLLDLPSVATELHLPANLPLGYHRLGIGRRGDGAAATLIVTPSRLDLPSSLAEDRAWGLAAQLYSVRSRDSWGVGDLADLRRLGAWAGRELGADFLLVNPLSAAEPVGRMEPSPYLPTARAFVNPVYLRIEDIPEYAALPPAERAEVDALGSEVHRALDGADTIDRDRAWAAKIAALRLLHRVPRPPEREQAYQDFLDREGPLLQSFAVWCAAALEHGTDWRTWPEALRHPEAPGVAAFRARAAEAVDFFQWLQWLLDGELAAAQVAATTAGMRIGIMHDLAVGVHPTGADSWALQDVFATGVTVGAPPDGFNQVGQDWSQPPWRPDRLAELGYAPYRSLIAGLLRHAGALRVDHIIGLFRLWCIPDGAPASAGTYLHFDHEALIGILVLEAHRAGAVIVGEDLGNVAPSTRDYLLRRGIIGTSILWFERDDEGRPLPAERWREWSLASVTTHDLPPTAGYLAGDHVELRDRLGLLTRPVDEVRAADEADREAWLTEVTRAGAMTPGADTQAVVEGLYRYLGRTPARLLGVALTDLVGDRRTQNQPGTADEYPNWRVPLSGPDGRPLLLEDVEVSPRARRLADVVQTTLRPPKV